jgi:hypothetical protein
MNAMRRPAERRRIMIDFEMPRSSFEYLRRRCTLHLFRLSNRVLRIAISLHHTQLAPHASVRVALSASALLEKTAAALLFGQRYNRRGAGFEKEYEK